MRIENTARMTHELTKVSLATSRHMSELNRKSTRAAVASSRATRINVQLFLVGAQIRFRLSSITDLLQVTTPFVIALQYFGAEHDIFAFERTSATFVYALCILFCGIPVLVYALGVLNDALPNLFKSIKQWIGHTSRKEYSEKEENCLRV